MDINSVVSVLRIFLQNENESDSKFRLDNERDIIFRNDVEGEAELVDIVSRVSGHSRFFLFT